MVIAINALGNIGTVVFVKHHFALMERVEDGDVNVPEGSRLN